MPEIRIYATRNEKGKLAQISKKTGVSMSKLLLKGFDYWINNNPKELKVVAKEFHSIELEREAKERERDSGDLLGSYQKKRDKIARIRTAYKDKDITKAERDRMIEETERNFKVTTEIKKTRLLKTDSKQKTKGIPPKDMPEQRRQKLEYFKNVWLEEHGLV